jgi:hypothetical protein
MFDKLLSKLFKKATPLYVSGRSLRGLGDGMSFSSEPFLQLTTSGSFAGSSGQNGMVGNAPRKRLAVKPVKLFRELMCDEPKFKLGDIDAQIKFVERRRNLLREELGVGTGDEEEALIYLRARKKLLKKEHNFKWAVTKNSLIKSLCEKYAVSLVSFEAYSKTIPMEAVRELELYLKEHKKYTDAKPVLKLIIDDAPPPGKQQSAERKKDPILLASSPFGAWWFILGAWDKEVAIVDDLVYHGK